MINRDFRDLFAAFVDPEASNAERVLGALVDFGAPVGDLAPDDFADPECVFQVGMAPNRVDILCGVTGVSFEEVWVGRIAATYGDVEIHYIGLEDLIRSKRAAGRPQDLVDADELDRRRRGGP